MISAATRSAGNAVSTGWEYVWFASSLPAARMTGARSRCSSSHRPTANTVIGTESSAASVSSRCARERSCSASCGPRWKVSATWGRSRGPWATAVAAPPGISPGPGGAAVAAAPELTGRAAAADIPADADAGGLDPPVAQAASPAAVNAVPAADRNWRRDDRPATLSGMRIRSGRWGGPSVAPSRAQDIDGKFYDKSYSA